MISTPNLKCGAPIQVTTSVTISPGQTKIPPLGELNFGTRYSILVDEIRFRIKSTNGNNPTLPSTRVADLRGNIRVDFKFGRLGITDGFTPLWNLGKVDSNDQYYFNPAGDSASIAADGIKVITSSNWRLPNALYLPPSAIIQPTFTYATGSASTVGVTLKDAEVTMTVSGRAILPGQPVPARWPIPSVLFYEATPLGYQTSQGSQLANTSRNDLHVRRMTLRVWDQRPVFPATPLGEVYFGADFLTSSADEPASNSLLFRLRDREGTMLTKDYVPGPLLVDLNSRAWDMDALLPHEDYFRVEVQQNPNPSSTVSGLYSHVCFLGSRMENL